ncbi:hypothetical protein HLASF_1570 [Halanaeroarchaeum sulfurireducens]|uniref:Uncharacterized protein n=1 Tax=Halanaeroarchaeum sulfurireducens TaxID=1604004 RepID=A0A0F7PEM5_9EURY|nr:hypothetical protein HLASF_1570 [Halanaeroarchaeum sulfurireducens]ALG82443.1 hypothetical protein HLASA_1557 [Halanaeroarchaeum sulfurireducens]
MSAYSNGVPGKSMGEKTDQVSRRGVPLSNHKVLSSITTLSSGKRSIANSGNIGRSGGHGGIPIDRY